MANPFLIHSQLNKPRGDKVIRLQISRNTLIASIISLIIHALVLLTIWPNLDLNASAKRTTTLEVSLAPLPQATPEIPQSVPEPLPEIQPEPPAVKPIEKKPKPKVITKQAKPQQKPVFTVPKEMEKQPMEEAPSPIAKPETNTAKPAEPTDMASYIKAQQAKRNMGEVDAARQNAEAVAREQSPSEDEIRNERIKNNLKVGTNGIFEITTLSGRHAAFSFKGWTDNYSNARREYFEVEASTGEDVRLVMVKKMISLIRQHYQGDFNWESQRLNRTIVKSARIEDNAELEEFLMMEFFGTHYKNAAY